MSRVADLRAALKRAPLRTLPRRALLRARYGPSRLDAGYLEAIALAAWRAQGAAPLADPPADPDGPLHVAFVLPFFTRGSGGHTTLSNLVRGLERRGHRVSLWIDDPGQRLPQPERAHERFREWFGPFQAEVHRDFAAWKGADVAVATSYQTALRTRTLPGAASRAYLVQDHEPEFFATSAESVHATESYRLGFHAVTAGTWLAEFVAERYGMSATPFELAVDHDIYRPYPSEPRQDDTVILYARSVTPRRAVPIALSAIAEVRKRRPDLRIELFGQDDPPRVDFPVENHGIVGGTDLARLYARATVGVCLSLTNYSLVPQEMLACGLACVEVDSPSVVGAFGHDGPVVLAPPEPHRLAAAIERLLDDPAERARRVEEGRRWVALRTWDRAAEQLEEGLREALRRRAG